MFFKWEESQLAEKAQEEKHQGKKNKAQFKLGLIRLFNNTTNKRNQFLSHNQSDT